MSRDYDSIINEWNALEKEKKIILKVLDTPMLNTDSQADGSLSNRFVRDMLLLNQAYQAHSEWQKIKSRQAQGIDVAKSKGKALGRPKTKISREKAKIVRRYINKQTTIETALKSLGIKKSAFYNLCRTIKK